VARHALGGTALPLAVLRVGGGGAAAAAAEAAGDDGGGVHGCVFAAVGDDGAPARRCCAPALAHLYAARNDAGLVGAVVADGGRCPYFAFASEKHGLAVFRAARRRGATMTRALAGVRGLAFADGSTLAVLADDALHVVSLAAAAAPPGEDDAEPPAGDADAASKRAALDALAAIGGDADW